MSLGVEKTEEDPKRDRFEFDRACREAGALSPGKEFGEVTWLDRVRPGDPGPAGQPPRKGFERAPGGQLIVGRQTALGGKIEQELVDELIHAMETRLRRQPRRESSPVLLFAVSAGGKRSLAP